MNRTKFLIAAAMSALVCLPVSAWSKFGHEVTIKVAERHLTPKAKEIIAKYMPYDLATDAVWMDEHRNDKEIAYTTRWHAFYADSNNVYTPNPVLKKGDVMNALTIADWNLRHYKTLSDSAVLMNLRFILHFVGDLHCPTHVMHLAHLTKKYPVMWNGKKYKHFHTVYDKLPHIIYVKKPADEIAAVVDNVSKGKAKKIAQGTFYDWAAQTARDCEIIYEWNPVGITEVNPKTQELSTDLVNQQLRYGGYRLARLLNEYFK